MTGIAKPSKGCLREESDFRWPSCDLHTHHIVETLIEQGIGDVNIFGPRLRRENASVLSQGFRRQTHPFWCSVSGYTVSSGRHHAVSLLWWPLTTNEVITLTSTKKRSEQKNYKPPPTSTIHLLLSCYVTGVGNENITWRRLDQCPNKAKKKAYGPKSRTLLPWSDSKGKKNAEHACIMTRQQWYMDMHRKCSIIKMHANAHAQRELQKTKVRFAKTQTVMLYTIIK